MVMKNNFTDIFDEFSPKIARYLTRLVGEDEAEDLTQIVFEKVNSNLNNFRGESKLSTWIYRIATNAARDKLKSSSYIRSTVGPLAPLPLELYQTNEISVISENKSVSPEHSLIREEMSECVQEFVSGLSSDYRTIIILNELEDFTNKEISEILKISLDTVKIRLHRARAKLKESLKGGCDFYHDDRSELVCDRKQMVQIRKESLPEVI